MNNINLFKNTRYYKWIGAETIEEVRIIKIQNSDIVSIVFTKGPRFGQKEKMQCKDLLNNYTKLKPDGFLTFNIVSLKDTLKDVIVTVTRESDVTMGKTIPYAVCRQCVVDLFAKQLSPDNVDYAGISISQDTCPADVDFSNYFACDRILSSEVVAFYIGDKVTNILHILKDKDEYDSILDNLHLDHCKYLAGNNKFITESYRRKKEIDGYCKTLDDLLRINNFEYDLETAFGVIPLDLEYLKEDGTGIVVMDPVSNSATLSTLGKEILSSVLLVQIDKSLVLKFDKDIDLDAIKRKYCLITDKNYNVYLVAYTISGKYHPDIESVEDEENIKKLMKNIPTESVQLAYSHLQFRKEKYNK